VRSGRKCNTIFGEGEWSLDVTEFFNGPLGTTYVTSILFRTRGKGYIPPYSRHIAKEVV
jgi:hypothetical protein